MQKNRKSYHLFTALLSICAFLFIGIVMGVLFGCSGKSKQAKVSHEGLSEKRIIAELPKLAKLSQLREP